MYTRNTTNETTLSITNNSPSTKFGLNNNTKYISPHKGESQIKGITNEDCHLKMSMLLTKLKFHWCSQVSKHCEVSGKHPFLEMRKPFLQTWNQDAKLTGSKSVPCATRFLSVHLKNLCVVTPAHPKSQRTLQLTDLLP